MGKLVQTIKKTDREKRIAVLRLEIDYELATLHDAIVTEDSEKISESKKNLKKFHQELIRLNG